MNRCLRRSNELLTEKQFPAIGKAHKNARKRYFSEVVPVLSREVVLLALIAGVCFRNR